MPPAIKEHKFYHKSAKHIFLFMHFRNASANLNCFRKSHDIKVYNKGLLMNKE